MPETANRSVDSQGSAFISREVLICTCVPHRRYHKNRGPMLHVHGESLANGRSQEQKNQHKVPSVVPICD